MDIRFYLDDSGLPHTHKHYVTEPEVEEVLQGPLEDRSGVEGTRVAIGQTAAGRFIRIVYVLEQDRDALFVLTAYDPGRKRSRHCAVD
jgi:hypothetical protein